MSMPVFSGAIVSAPNGQILCQLRDNKPEIICPGLWCCCPGGMIEQDELPQDAMLRELKEEFDIEVTNISPLLEHQETSGEFQGVYHSFSVDLFTPLDKVACHEGQCIEFFTPERARQLPQHPVSLIFLDTFMDKIFP